MTYFAINFRKMWNEIIHAKRMDFVTECGPTFFTCAPTRSARLAFICEKLILEKSELSLILFYFKGKIKQEIKP